MRMIVAMFDADGTLLDTMGGHADLAADCMVRYFDVSREVARRDYIRTTGSPFHEQLEILFPGESCARARAECAREYHARKVEEVYGQAKAFPDVAPGLEALRRKNVTQFVSTSTERLLIEGALGRNGLNDMFAQKYCLENGSKRDHIHDVGSLKFEAENARTFFVGDSPHDAELSRYGVTTIGRHGNPEDGMHTAEALRAAGAKYVTDDFRSLAEIIRTETGIQDSA